jgi:transposase InsO family protein
MPERNRVPLEPVMSWPNTENPPVSSCPLPLLVRTPATPTTIAAIRMMSPRMTIMTLSKDLPAPTVEPHSPQGHGDGVEGFTEGGKAGMGGWGSASATLVDRKSRFLTVVKLASRHTTVVVPALAETYERMDPRLRNSLTWDRGMEPAAHKRFTADTGVDVFFAAPRSPWQRGTNENTNKLLRQYLPKGTNLSTFSQDDLDAIATKLNNRPRKCLGFRTPAESVALTG